MEGKKYEFTDGILFHRIRALKDFGDVKKGDVGGFIESEDNLSHEGNCWVYDNALVEGNAKVSEDIAIRDRAIIRDNAIIKGHGDIGGDAIICNHVVINGCVNIRDSVKVSGNAEILGRVGIWDYAKVTGNAIISPKDEIVIDSDLYFGDNAYITSRKDWMAITNVGSRWDTITLYRCEGTRNKYIGVHTGCFIGDLKDFATEVLNTHGGNQYAQEYLNIIQLAMLHFNTKMV